MARLTLLPFEPFWRSFIVSYSNKFTEVWHRTFLGFSGTRADSGLAESLIRLTWVLSSTPVWMASTGQQGNRKLKGGIFEFASMVNGEFLCFVNLQEYSWTKSWLDAGVMIG